MAEDPLRELLSSPLDDEPKRRSARPAERVVQAQDEGDGPPGGSVPPTWIWFLAALAIGAAAVLIGYSIGGDELAAPNTVATTVATTTTVAEAPDSPFPEGFVEVDDFVAMQIERILVRDDATFVTVSSVAAEGLEPTQTPAFPGGLWALVLNDGTRITSSAEGSDAAAQGFVSVVFPTEGFEAGDIASVELVGIATRLNQVFSAATSTALTLPEDGTAVTVGLVPDSFVLDSGVEISFSDLEMTAELGKLEWELTGSDEDALARVTPVLTLNHADGSGELTATRVDTGAFRFFLSFFGSNPSSREGTVYFDPDPSSPTFTVGEPLEGAFDIEVGWSVFTPTSVEFPVSDTVIVALDG